MTDKEFEFRQQWTHVAGKVSAYDDVISAIQADSGMAFVHNRMEAANWLKELAERLEQRAKPLRADLQRFIEIGTNKVKEGRDG